MASRLRLRSLSGEGHLAWSAGSPILVVLAEDHAPMRRSLRGLLDDEEDLHVVGEADDLATLEREVRLRRPHVLALDLGMRDRTTGVGAITIVREGGLEVRIVGLTMQDDPAFARHALAAGALGFVYKDLADVELAPAIRAAARGERFVSLRVAGRLGGG